MPRSFQYNDAQCGNKSDSGSGRCGLPPAVHGVEFERMWKRSGPLRAAHPFILTADRPTNA